MIKMQLKGSPALILALLLASINSYGSVQPLGTGIDSQAAAAISALNQAEIEMNKLALQTAVTDEVREYSDVTIDRYSRLEARFTKTLENLRIQMKTSWISRAIEQETKKNLFRLTYLAKSGSAAEFDRAFIYNEMRTHSNAIRLIDQVLLPRVRIYKFSLELLRIRMILLENYDAAVYVGHILGIKVPLPESE